MMRTTAIDRKQEQKAEMTLFTACHPLLHIHQTTFSARLLRLLLSTGTVTRHGDGPASQRDQ